MQYAELDGSDGMGFMGAPVSQMEDPYNARPRQQAAPQQVQQPAQQQPQAGVAALQPPAVQTLRYTPQQVAYAQQQAGGQQPQQYAPPRYGPSYLEQLWSSRREMTKLFMLAMVVTIGLAVHGCGKHVLKYVMADQVWTFNQELMIRGAYPLLVLFVAWNLRLMLQSR